jgi:FKBP-type peptidyl-prolyl cis-trans isomerase
MKKLVIISLLGIFLAFKIQAQCTDCKTVKLDKVDFCFTSQEFPGFCAQFEEKKSIFYYQNGKKIQDLKLPEKYNKEYFIELARNKKLKTSAMEVLFLQEALSTWMVEKTKIGYSFTPSGLGIKIVSEGSGELPKRGQNVIVHYSGYLEDGTKFDSSVDRNAPFKFPLGAGRVIKGWDEGVAELKIGTRAWLRIPSDLGYGSRGAGGAIPPNATLLFEIEVIGVE